MNRQTQFTTPFVVLMLDEPIHTDEQPHCHDHTCPCQCCLVCEDRHPLHLRHCTKCHHLVCLQHSRRIGFLVVCQECEEQEYLHNFTQGPREEEPDFSRCLGCGHLKSGIIASYLCDQCRAEVK